MANIFTQIEDEIWSLVETESNPLGLFVKGLSPTGKAFTAAVDNTITSAAHGLADAIAIRLSTTDTLPPPLAVDTLYYVRDATTDTFKLALAAGGPEIDITGTGTGTHTWLEGWTVATHVVRVKSSSPREDPGQAADLAIVYAGAESNAPYYAGTDRLWTRHVKFDLALRANAFKIENLQEFILAFIDTVEKYRTPGATPSRILAIQSVAVREFGAMEQPSDELRGSVTFAVTFERATG